MIEHCSKCGRERPNQIGDPTCPGGDGYCNWTPRVERTTARVKNELQYRVTQLQVPLAQEREFIPKPPTGDGWKPSAIGGNEIVLYTLWVRLVEVETNDEGNVIRETSLVP